MNDLSHKVTSGTRRDGLREEFISLFLNSRSQDPERLADSVLRIITMRALAYTPHLDARSGWFCPHCEEGVPPSEVTFEETHTACGTYIGMSTPPPMGNAVRRVWLEAAVQALHAELRIFEAKCAECRKND